MVSVFLDHSRLKMCSPDLTCSRFITGLMRLILSSQRSHTLFDSQKWISPKPVPRCPAGSISAASESPGLLQIPTPIDENKREK